MLLHAFLRVGEDICLKHILLPPLSFCSVCLSILFFIACLPARAQRGMAISEKIIKALFKKMDSRREVKFTSSACKLSSSA